MVAGITTTHKVLGTYADKVDAYIAVTEFSKQKFIQGGLPGARIHVKPNFISDNGVGDHGGDFAYLPVG